MTESIPIDPHNEKWSKLVVPQKKTQETVQDVNTKMADYLRLSGSIHTTLSASLQNQAFKEISKQNERLVNYHEEIQTRYEELLRRKQFQPFPRYGAEHLKNDYIVNPERISPLLNAAEERVKVLEDEMVFRDREISKLANMVELLIEENKYLRDHIAFKNKDIVKILETIGLNDGEVVHELKHKLSIVTEENNLLLSHMEDLKKFKINYDNYCKEKQKDVDEYKKGYDDIRADFNEALKREEDLTNKKSVLEVKLQKSDLRVMELERNIEDLLSELGSVQKVEAHAKTQAQSYKKKLEEIEHRNTFELDGLKQETTNLKNDKKELSHQIDQLNRQIELLKEEIRKLYRSNEEKQLELEDVPSKVRDLKDQIEIEREKHSELLLKEKEWKEKYDSVTIDANAANSKVIQVESQAQQMEENLRNDFKSRQAKYEKAIENLKQKNTEYSNEKEAETQSLNKQISDMKKVIDRLREEKNSLINQSPSHGVASQHLTNLIAEKDDELVQLRSEVTILKKNLRDQEVLRRQTEAMMDENVYLKETSKNFRPVFREQQREIIESRPIADPVQAEPTRKASPIKESEASAPIQNVYNMEVQQPVIRETFHEQPKQELSKTAQSFKVSNDISREEARRPASREERIASDNAYLSNLVRNVNTTSNVREEAETLRQGRSLVTRHEQRVYSPSPNPDVERSYGSRERRDESVDQVITSILEKYHLKEVPNKNELDKIFVKEQLVGTRSRSGERRLSPTSELQIRTYDYSRDQNVLRESGVGFISPVMSSADRSDLRFESNVRPK